MGVGGQFFNLGGSRFFLCPFNTEFFISCKVRSKELFSATSLLALTLYIRTLLEQHFIFFWVGDMSSSFSPTPQRGCKTFVFLSGIDCNCSDSVVQQSFAKSKVFAVLAKTTSCETLKIVSCLVSAPHKYR